MKKLLALLVTVFAAGLVVTAMAVAGRGPDRIELPDGFRPEGIAPGKGKSVYVGSIPTGRVLEINVKTGASREAVPAREDHAAIGLKYDRRRDRLFVSGGPTGKAFVYDADTGAELAALQLAEGSPTFINDVVLTRRVAYFTDSEQPAIYAVRRNLSDVRTIELEDFPMSPDGLDLNGIEAARRGRVLLAVQGSTGVLWRIDPATGSYDEVDLPERQNLENGDGLLLVGRRTLLVVQNRLNQIAVVRLNRGFTSGRVVRTITDSDFDVPTTVALKRGKLYLPNARFSTPPTPETEYWVTRVDGR